MWHHYFLCRWLVFFSTLLIVFSPKVKLHLLLYCLYRVIDNQTASYCTVYKMDRWISGEKTLYSCIVFIQPYYSSSSWIFQGKMVHPVSYTILYLLFGLQTESFVVSSFFSCFSWICSCVTFGGEMFGGTANNSDIWNVASSPIYTLFFVTSQCGVFYLLIRFFYTKS